MFTLELPFTSFRQDWTRPPCLGDQLARPCALVTVNFDFKRQIRKNRIADKHGRRDRASRLPLRFPTPRTSKRT